MGKKLIDLDCTLINGELRVDMEIRAAMEHGFTPAEFIRGREVAVAKFGLSDFNYRKLHWGLNKVKPGLSESIIGELYDIVATPMFFPDTLAFLDAFSKEELVLLTTGDPHFQNIKIDTHGLRDKFSEIMIVPSPKCQSIVDPAPGTVFVDDSPREIDAMKLLHPSIFCVQVREPAPWEHQRASQYRDARVSDLMEAAHLIKNRQV